MSAVVVVLTLVLAVGVITVAVLLPVLFVRPAVPLGATKPQPGATSATTTIATAQATTAQGAATTPGGATTATPTVAASGVVSVVENNAQLYFGPGSFNMFAPARLLSSGTLLEVQARATDAFGVVFLRVRRCGQAVSSPSEEWIEEIDVATSTSPCPPAP